MRIFIPLESPDVPSLIKVPPDKARYLISVMRVKKGDALEVIGGGGHVYRAAVARITGKDLHIDLVERLSSRRQTAVRLILCQSLLKAAKIDLVVQKTTELGVAEICPVIAERSVVRETSKTARWRKIAEEAAEQSGRTDIPAVADLKSYTSFLDEHGNALKGRGLLLSTRGGVSLREGLRRVLKGDAPTASDGRNTPAGPGDRPVFLIVGPEGGLTAEEEEAGLDHGLVAVSMGGLILRAETAAIAATAILQNLIHENAVAE